MLFTCEKCGKTANTAKTRYWQRNDDERALCEDCDEKLKEIKYKHERAAEKIDYIESLRIKKLLDRKEAEDYERENKRNNLP
jgi:NAD-dependent SIR2 family protein deacetylase